MLKPDVRLVLVKIVKESFGYTLTESDLHKDFYEIGMDSFHVIKIIVGIERELKIEFEDDELDFYKYNNLEKIAEYIEKRLT
ncbi:acyl carrier protein [Brevibacillus laterosporus]|uniref:Carrier domain-containing protein n=1 Tax=Brevibacillus laterosporus TaxID=1465 RepID=A0A0F7C1R9_BRELA|nr:acyl carrier protein [Brevibacillus laterosporus]AKF95957.1 hypothetical protein EX87_20490 [Brevibacillus laterosporus]